MRSEPAESLGDRLNGILGARGEAEHEQFGRVDVKAGGQLCPIDRRNVQAAAQAVRLFPSTRERLRASDCISAAPAGSSAELVTVDVTNVWRYCWRVIRSFRGKDAEAIWQRRYVKRIGPELGRLAYNKLALIDAAGTINDLRVPPGNRLEKLSGDRAGQYSVRVNDQWRICFTWSAGGASNVEFVDYH